MAQCTSSFPYVEDFETTNGGWISGGNASDWVWGKPQKSIINHAASGIRAWMVGDSTGNSYADGEESWIQSPCFDLSALQFPVIEFNIWWESEATFDGSGFQYSIDNGSTWKEVGSSTDPKDCLNQNWYNTRSVRYLTLMPSLMGWSGSSGAWVPAKKGLPAVAGKSNVIFRFVFGAGTRLNNFNGVAIDDFGISEAQPASAGFTASCSGNNTATFNNTSTCAVGFAWNFDDPASGAANTSTIKSPSHIYSAPGTYSVSLAVKNPDNSITTITHDVTILDVTSTITTPIKCGGDNNGVVTVNVSGGTTPYTYSWNTTPVQNNATATNLTAGSYTVNVTATNACATSLTVNLTEPSPLSHTITTINPGCTATKGAINITETGGTEPYTYLWSPNVSTTSSASGLAPRQYDITVTDKSFCTDIFSVDIIQLTPPAVTIDNKTNVSCNAGNNGAATATIVGGNDPFVYGWNTNPVQTTPTATNLKAGNYTFTVKDSNDCVSTAQVTITEPLPITATVQTTNATCGLKNGSIAISPSGNVSDYEYIWTPNVSSSNSAVNIKSGQYAVQLNTSAGCSKEINNILLSNIGLPNKIFLGKDTTICSGEKTILYPGKFTGYLWQDNSTAPSFSVSQNGKYFVQVTNKDGCVSSDTIAVNFVDNCIDIYFPTSFSPNNDGLNDSYGPVGNFNAISEYSLSIYNRWGQLMFLSKNPREKWMGLNDKNIAVGTYVWFASYIFNGQGKKSKKGSIIITP